MGRGVKIGGSRGPKCRLDPLLGPFLVILSHFGPFWDAGLEALGMGARSPLCRGGDALGGGGAPVAHPRAEALDAQPQSSGGVSRNGPLVNKIKMVVFVVVDPNFSSLLQKTLLAC